FFIIVPKLLIAGFKKQKDALVDQKCLFSRAKGYLRQSLFLISPKLFSQEKFFQWLDFRGERETFNKNLNIK
ncbi:MAG: hypothetical protein GY699_26505, partial [Desulfobacteraceae bacterium]|nr:hypothetical protein [Desulfobacteraceae bacterium]